MPNMAAAVGCSQLPPSILTKCCQTNPLIIPSLSSSNRSWWNSWSNNNFGVNITNKPEVVIKPDSPDLKCNQTEWSGLPFLWSKDDQTKQDPTLPGPWSVGGQCKRNYQHLHTINSCFTLQELENQFLTCMTSLSPVPWTSNISWVLPPLLMMSGSTKYMVVT